MKVEIIANVTDIQQAKELLSEVEALKENYEVNLTINITFLEDFVM
ncbi:MULTISPECIES: hypothetical protein [Listeria]|nr:MULTISPECIES: hypothetical protein [Listeria]EEO3672990.1 hypothetical protein [Listeria monocytogenes]MBC1535266.1 hypothetical protein [Listeria immobilis]MBC1744534.1 hypothetical protein [Listeria seeligeri]MBC6123117.1 hypothetical protein [Listeria seeligeri]MBF2390483.1 hypothetical protein [Listeria seeligeri]